MWGCGGVGGRGDSDNTWLFDEKRGLDTAVPAATPLISLIEKATGASDTVALLRPSQGAVEAVCVRRRSARAHMGG